MLIIKYILSESKSLNLSSPTISTIFNNIKVKNFYDINEHEYNLISTAVHVGAQDDGHYVSFVKKRNKWFFINDEMVREEELPDEAGFYFMVYNLKATI